MLKLAGWVFVAIAFVAYLLHQRADLLREFRVESNGGEVPDHSRTLLIVAFIIVVLGDVIHFLW